MQLKEAIEKFLRHRESYCRPTTVRWYRDVLRDLERFFGETAPLEKLDADRLVQYVLDLNTRKQHIHGGPMSAQSLRTYIRSIKVFFGFAKTREWVRQNPAAVLHAPRVDPRPRALSLEQCQVLLAAVLQAQHTPLTKKRGGTVGWKESLRDHAVLCFALDTGCRANELCQLDVEDLNLTKGVAVIRRAKMNKTRAVGLGKGTREVLTDYLAGRESGPVFLNESRHRITYQTLRQICRRAGVRVGFSFTMHQLRHSYATLFLLNGGSPSHLQTLLGHANQEMTRHYAALALEQAALAAAAKNSVADRIFETPLPVLELAAV